MTPRVKGPKGQKRGRNNPEETRARLLDAVLTVAKKRGVGGLTTVSITREASIVQSAFYHYFEDLEDCKRQATRRVADRIRVVCRAWRYDVVGPKGTGYRPVADDFERMLDLFKSEGFLSEILLKLRHDESSMGVVVRELVEELRADFIEDFSLYAKLRGVPDAWRTRVAFSASLIMAMVMDSGEALLSGRCTDLRLMAEELARSTSAMVDAFLLDAAAEAKQGAPRKRGRKGGAKQP